MDISMVNDMIDFVNAKLKLFADSPLNPDKKKGGYLSCTDRKSGNCIFILPVGDIPAAKQKKYQTLAMEKASRVYKLDTFTSYETRDEAKDKWGGGISTLKYILAFSGLPELADEALMVSLAHHMEMPTEHTSELKTLDAYGKHLEEEKRTNEYLEFFIAE